MSEQRMNIDSIYPLSPVQQGMLFHTLLAPESGVYFNQVLYTLTGRLQKLAMQRAWQQVADRHEALRTLFVCEARDKPLQVVRRRVTLPWEEFDWRGLSADEQNAKRAAFLQTDRRRGFDLAQAPLMRLALIRLGENHHELIWSHHHVLIDGWSSFLILKDVMAIYQAISGGRDCRLEPVRPYRDYINWLQRQDPSKAEGFWRAALKGFVAPTSLLGSPTSGEYKVRDYEIAEQLGSTPPSLTAALESFARQNDLTLSTIVQGAWAILLSRYSGETDIVFGSTVSGRSAELVGIETMVGLFINSLPVRAQFSSQIPTLAWLKDFQDKLVEVQQYEHSPLVDVQGWSEVRRGQPLFQSLVAFENYLVDASVWGQDGTLQISNMRVVGPTNYPLAIVVVPKKELAIRVSYDSGRFDGAAISRMLGHFNTIMECIVANPGRRLAELPMLTAAERQQVLYEWNATAADYPKELCVHQLFEQQVERDPDAVAVVYEDRSLSYGELNARSNRLAHHLRGLGVGPDVLVAICVERSLEMVVGLLAILKAGGAYVPLDPSHPAERLAFMIEDSAPAVILTQTSLRERFSGRQIQVVCLGDDPAELERQSTDNPRYPVVANDLAYVIYTSGSTGVPKGVQIPHRSVVNFLTSLGRYPGITQADTLLAVTTLSFDIAGLELFLPLTTGARVVIVAREVAIDGKRLMAIMERLQATIMQATPATWRLMLESGWGGRPTLKILCGGEAWSAELVDELLPRCESLWNMYGPTETTIWSAVSRVEKDKPILIGPPIANTTFHVLDSDGQLVPVGIAGEIYIGGAGVARGYLNRPELTAERFIANPFVDGDRLYKTGDLGRYLADGNIEFLGRNDFQVKIRGYRIELGEIEARLSSCPGVREAAVLAPEDASGDKRLVAYYTAAGNEPGAEALRSHVAAALPEYMVPAGYLRLETMPLTANGKLDRKALPAVDEAACATQAYEAPVGPVETTIAEIWAEVLGREQVGRHHNFFDLGGHSLLALRVLVRMRSVGLEAEVRALFATPSLSAFAAEVGARSSVVEVPPNLIPPDCGAITPDMLPLCRLMPAEIEGIVCKVPGGVANIQDIYPLGPLQEGILFHHLLAKEGDPYLVARVISFVDRTKLEAFVAAMNAVIRRHDILRTSVVWEGLSEPMQVVWRHAPLDLQTVDLDPADGDIAEQLRQTFNPRHYRLDVRQAPMLRVIAAHEPTSGRWLGIELRHHLITDHATVEIMDREVRAYLEGGADALPAPLPFRDFVGQAKLGANQDAQRAFFRAMLGDVEEPSAPFGVTEVYGDGSGVTEVRVSLNRALTRRLRSRGRTLRVSPATLFHVAWGQVVARICGRADAVFGTVLFGHMQGGDAANRALGPFLNTLPVRLRLSKTGVEQCVRQTHDLLAELMIHEHAPLTLAQRCSAVPAPLPLFTSLLNYRHSAASAAAQPLAGIVNLGFEERTNYPLVLTVDDLSDGFALTVQAGGRIDAPRVIAMMQQALESLVGTLEWTPDRPASQLDILPPEERHRLLVEWNATAADYPKELCVHQLFEQQVERDPDAVAVVYKDRSLSYGELNARSNRLAHDLRELGVGPDVLVAICVERSLEMVVGLLAILKAGGAYVPLDPSYPGERLAFMIEDSAPAVILSHAPARSALEAAMTGSKTRPPILDLEADLPPRIGQASANPGLVEVGLTSSHLAYVIYTSGSTGTPKGVAITHEGLHNYVAWAVRYYRLDLGSGAPVLTPFAFDATATSLYLPILAGKQILLLPEEQQFDVIARGDTDAGKFSLLKLTPAHLDVLNHSASVANLKELTHCLVIGGDSLSEATVAPWRQRAPQTRLINEYGPTETVVGCVVYEVRPTDPDEGSVPIGRPISNTRIYLLDEGLQPVPVGVAGEIYIGGAGVARGYLNRPELTAERFIASPFVAGDRLYKTGDLGRYLSDGNIEFLGRNDFQVKIRGYRIELGEIETRLYSCPGLREVAVLAREDARGDKRLVAYYTAAGDEPGAEALRSHVAAALPEYMVPTAYVRLEALPLTANGKLDRKALPAPDEAAYATQTYEAPVGPVETTIAEIWAEVLGREQVGRHDNFFDLGGHSLLALRVLVQVNRSFGRTLPLLTIYDAPTIAGLASTLNSKQQLKFSPVVSLRSGETLPALFIVAGAGGSPMELALPASYIAGNRQIYGLQSIALDGVSKPHDTVEEMAEYYVRHIQEYQPNGPYLLAGFCFGGLVAVEIARRLLEAGEDVALLALLDARPHQRFLPLSRLFAYWRGRMYDRTYARAAALAQLPLREAVPYVLNRLWEAREPVLSGGLSVVFEAASIAWHRYRPRYYHGTITLLKCDKPGTPWQTYADFWAALADKLIVHIVPGDHLDIIRTHAESLGRQLSLCIERSLVPEGHAVNCAAAVRRSSEQDGLPELVTEQLPIR